MNVFEFEGIYYTNINGCWIFENGSEHLSVSAELFKTYTEEQLDKIRKSKTLKISLVQIEKYGKNERGYVTVEDTNLSSGQTFIKFDKAFMSIKSDKRYFFNKGNQYVFIFEV